MITIVLIVFLNNFLFCDEKRKMGHPNFQEETLVSATEFNVPRTTFLYKKAKNYNIFIFGTQHHNPALGEYFKENEQLNSHFLKNPSQWLFLIEGVHVKKHLVESPEISFFKNNFSDRILMDDYLPDSTEDKKIDIFLYKKFKEIHLADMFLLETQRAITISGVREKSLATLALKVSVHHFLEDEGIPIPKFVKTHMERIIKSRCRRFNISRRKYLSDVAKFLKFANSNQKKAVYLKNKSFEKWMLMRKQVSEAKLKKILRENPGVKNILFTIGQEHVAEVNNFFSNPENF